MDPLNKLANELLAASIHEIKNRFGLLFGQLDQLLDSLPLDETHQHSAEAIKAEAEFIGCELVRVLTSYKSTETEDPCQVSQQFLIDFLEEKVARHANTARANGLQLEYDCDEEIEGFFDPAIVSVVLDTAIYNAVKAGAKTIRLKCDSPQEHQDGFLHLEIHDDGPGFPASLLNQPIKLSSGNAEDRSTGLGLFFAQRLISRHQEDNKQGHIELTSSDPLGGACVRLFLPQ